MIQVDCAACQWSFGHSACADDMITPCRSESVCVHWTVGRGLSLNVMSCQSDSLVCHSMFVYVCMVLYTIVLHGMVNLP